MKINVLTTIKDYNNKDILNEGNKPIVWRDIVFQALNSFIQDEHPTNEIKYQCFSITQKVFASEEVELEIADIALILERITKIMTSPLICGRAKEFFDRK